MHAFHLLHALWITLAIAVPIPTYEAFGGESLEVRDVNNHAARSYSSIDSMIDKRAISPGNAENPTSNIEIVPRKLFRRVRPGDWLWDLVLGLSHAMTNEWGAKMVDSWVVPSPPATVAAAPPASGSGGIVVPTLESPTEQQDSSPPANFPSTDTPPSVNMFNPDGRGTYNCNANYCTQGGEDHTDRPAYKTKTDNP